jgi:hypothetical protein
VAADGERGSRASHAALDQMVILVIGLAVRAFAYSRTAVMYDDGPYILVPAVGVEPAS